MMTFLARLLRPQQMIGTLQRIPKSTSHQGFFRPTMSRPRIPPASPQGSHLSSPPGNPPDSLATPLGLCRASHWTRLKVSLLPSFSSVLTLSAEYFYAHYYNGSVCNSPVVSAVALLTDHCGYDVARSATSGEDVYSKYVCADGKICCSAPPARTPCPPDLLTPHPSQAW